MISSSESREGVEFGKGYGLMKTGHIGIVRSNGYVEPRTMSNAEAERRERAARQMYTATDNFCRWRHALRRRGTSHGSAKWWGLDSDKEEVYMSPL